MKICVGIPSYNEANRISFVTSQIDKGLSVLQSKYPQIENGVILNADSCSSDNTVNIFNSTSTFFQKDSILTSGDPGKGKNILAILQYAVDKSFDVIITIDADIESITPEWIMAFFEPVINKRSDFVYPEYKRNRFEGSATNHFAYPLLYAYFGQDMRQPIGGDFAMNLHYARHILQQKIPSGAYKYGIDIFLSMNATINGFVITTAKLGEKVHKPSFPRMREMFPQIASSAIETMRTHTRSLTFEPSDNTVVNIIDKTKFVYSKEADAICEEECHNLFMLLERDPVWLDEQTIKELKSFLPNDYRKFDASCWVAVLGNWVMFALKNLNVDTDKHARDLLPFFIIRVVNFWHESETQSAIWVETEIRRQANALKKYFDKK